MAEQRISKALDADRKRNGPAAVLAPMTLYDWCAVVGLGVLAGCTVAAFVRLVIIAFGG